MNKLALTEEQRDRLLQMCNDLFPEYDVVEYYDNTERCHFLKEETETDIHWLELCILEISKRISGGFDTVYPKEKYAFIIDMMMKKMLDFSYVKKEHPIDYLYNLYQQTLKDEK